MGTTGQPPFSHSPSVKLNVDRRQYRQEALNGASPLLVRMWVQACSQMHTCKQMNALTSCTEVWPQK